MMAAMKNLVICILELYENGYTVQKISEIYNLDQKIIDQILSEYCEIA